MTYLTSGVWGRPHLVQSPSLSHQLDHRHDLLRHGTVVQRQPALHFHFHRGFSRTVVPPSPQSDASLVAPEVARRLAHDSPDGAGPADQPLAVDGDQPQRLGRHGVRSRPDTLSRRRRRCTSSTRPSSANPLSTRPTAPALGRRNRRCTSAKSPSVSETNRSRSTLQPRPRSPSGVHVPPPSVDRGRSSELRLLVPFAVVPAARLVRHGRPFVPADASPSAPSVSRSRLGLRSSPPVARRRSRTTRRTSSNGKQRMERRSNIRTTVTLFIVTATFILMYLPSIVITLFNIKPNEFREILFLLYFVNSAVSPPSLSLLTLSVRSSAF